MSNDLTVHAPLQIGSFDQAMRLADMMSGGKLVPMHLQKSPADCLMVIEQSMRWGMSPFAVAQSTSVIQGKLMFEGKLVAAVINSRGDLEEKLSYEYQGTGDTRSVTVSGKVKGEPSPRTVSVVLKDARTQNKVWQTQPDQQLMYHGARVWARRHMPELMLGVYVPEEMDVAPMRDVTPERPKRQTADPLATPPAIGQASAPSPQQTPASPEVDPPSRGAPSPSTPTPLDLPFVMMTGEIKSCTSRPTFLSMMEAAFEGGEPEAALECFFNNQGVLNDLQALAFKNHAGAKGEKASATALAVLDRVNAIFGTAAELQKAMKG